MHGEKGMGSGDGRFQGWLGGGSKEHCCRGGQWGGMCDGKGRLVHLGVAGWLE